MHPSRRRRANPINTARGTAAIATLVLLLLATLAAADELKVITSGAFAAAIWRSPHSSSADRSQSDDRSHPMGTAENGIVARLACGETTDVVIVTSGDLGGLIKGGRIRAGTRVDLARSAIGMAVRRGAPKPDISTVDALRRTLLQAKSIAYSSSVSGVYLSTELCQKLGIADQVLPKSRKVEGAARRHRRRTRRSEIGFQEISELARIPWIDFVGPLPAEVPR